MTLGESTTLDILTGDTDVVTLGHKGAESKSLSSSPVNALTLIDSLLAVSQDTLEVLVEGEALGATTTADLLSNVLQQRTLNTSGEVRQNLSGKLLGGLETVPGGGEPLLASGLVVLAAVEAVVQHAPDPLLVLIDVLLGEGTLLDQLVDVLVKLALLLSNALVHQRLGERGLVGLVVTLLTVADDVDDNVTLELGTPVGSNLADVVDSLNVIGVHVEDRSVNGLGNVRAVRGGAGEAGVSGETDLVVHNNVDSTTGGVGGKRVESHGLVDDTLGGKSGITVQQHTHGGVEVLLILVVVLDGASLSENDRVLSLQVRGVGDQGKLDTLTRGGRALEVHTQVVLDITGSLVGGLGGTSELTEDGLVGLTDDVGEDVQTTTVRHTDDDVLDTVVDTAVDEGLHTGHKGLTTLQTETLVVGELGRKEGLEAVGPDQAVEDAALVIDRVLVGLGNLEAVANPVAGLTVGDVDVLHTVGAAVDLLASGDNLAQGHLLASLGGETGQDTGSKVELLVQIALSESVVVQLELLGLVVTEGLGLTADAKRIDLGLVVTTSLVGADQELNLQVIRDIGTGRERQACAGHLLRNTTGRGRDESRRRLESLGDGHVALLHVLEIRLP